MKYRPHLVLGICGRSGAGKSTLADRIRQWFHHCHREVPVVRKSFAEPLKSMLAHVGVEKGHDLYRDAAQVVGTDFFRARDADFWLRITQDAIRGLSRPSVVLLDDVRFENEASAVDVLVKLHTERLGDLTCEQMLHPSERRWESMSCHLVFQNDTGDDLNFAVDTTVARIMELWEQR